MSNVDVTAKLMASDRETVMREIKVSYDFGDNMAQTVKKFGEDVTHDNAVANMTIGLQAFLRGKLKLEGKEKMTDAGIRAAVAAWKPGVRKEMDPKARMARAARDLALLPAAEKAKLLKLLQTA